MHKLDLKKQLKHLYQPSAREVSLVDVPSMQFAMVDGVIPAGAAVESSENFRHALEALYRIAYTLKFRSRLRKKDPIDYPRKVGMRLLVLSAVLAALWACRPQREQSEPEAALAEQALRGFFADLHAGRYAQAAAAYAGSYETMIDHNPGLDPADHAALFHNACTINGAQCLQVRSARLLESTEAGEFRFEVEFQLEDGSLFVQGPCCEGSATDFPPLSSFTYTVSKGQDGRFRVVEMPVYVP